MKNVTFTIIIGLCSALGVIILFIIAPFTLLINSIFEVGESPPEIKYGEFPFKLVYEVDGERKEIEDTLICEFDGFDWNEANGRYRKWKRRLASGNNEILLFNVNSTVNIYFDPGPAKYFMGDCTANEFTTDFPNARKSVTIDDKYYSGYPIDAEQLMKLYKIKLISWDYTEPIINSF